MFRLLVSGGSWSPCYYVVLCLVFFFQAEDGIRDLVRSRGLGDVYKRQGLHFFLLRIGPFFHFGLFFLGRLRHQMFVDRAYQLSLIHI